MLRIKDIVLLIVVFGSMAAGVLWPHETRKLGPFLSWFLMGMLFLAFLKVLPSAIWDTLHRYSVKLPLLILAKLIVIPLIIYPLAIKLLPAYALGLHIVGRGLYRFVSSFFFRLCRGQHSFGTGHDRSNHVIVALDPAAYSKNLDWQRTAFRPDGPRRVHGGLDFSSSRGLGFFSAMLPRISDWLDEHSYPISLVLLAAMNLGAFGLYAPFLRAHHAEVVISVLVGSGLAAVLASAGMFLFWSNPPLERVAAGGALGWINNVLVIVLGNYFNDPFTSVLAALYLIPYYVLIIPLGHLSRRLERSERFKQTPL